MFITMLLYLSLQDIPGPVPASATTQRWTTPLQHAVTARVPLVEEYPIRRKKHVDPTIFRKLDTNAIQVRCISATVEMQYLMC